MKCDHKRDLKRLRVKNGRWVDEPKLGRPITNMNKRKCEECNTVWKIQKCNAQNSCGKERILCECPNRKSLHYAVGWHTPKHTYRGSE
jgi:hypothetical protein